MQLVAATGLSRREAAARCGRPFGTPTSQECSDGVQVAVAQASGLPSGVPFEAAALEPLAAYLSTPVAV